MEITALKLRKKVVAHIFIITLLGCFIVASGHPYSADGISLIMVSSSIASGNGFALEKEFGRNTSELLPPLSMKGRNDNIYSIYAPLNSVLMLPFVVMGKLLAAFAPPGFPPEMPLYFMASFFNSFTTAAAAAFLAWLCMATGLSGVTAAATALLFAFATIAFPYSRTSFSDPMASMLILWCFCGIAACRRSGSRAAFTSIFIAAALLPLSRLSAAIVAFLPLLIYSLSAEKRGRVIFVLLSGLFVGVLVSAGYNFLRFESVFVTGYKSGWHLDVITLAAFYGYLLSSDKSIFVYSPVLLLAIPGVVLAVKRGFRAEVVFTVSITVISLVLYSAWSDWGGGHSWGPRFLLPLTPLLMYLAAFYIEREKGVIQKTLFITICAISLLVQFCAVSAKYTPNYENDFVAEQINDAAVEGRLLVPGAPRFLPMKRQVADTARNWKYTVTHLREYSGSRGGFEDLLDSRLVEYSPDSWPFLVAASSGGKIAILCFAALFLLLTFFLVIFVDLIKILKVYP